jgi:precorrin-2 dehydrogenase/sirohydrochlorin ferrochelatase
VSGVPILVEGAQLRVLIVGGGAVATRKAQRFAHAGADVRIVAPQLCEELEALVSERALLVERRPYEEGDVGDAQLVFAATNDRHVNAAVSREAERENRLINAADLTDDGNFAVMAMHRRGPLTVGVSAGGVPAAAMRIRDAIAERFDARYADVLNQLTTLRRRMLATDQAVEWRARSEALIDAGFCDAVEEGSISERIASWP